MIGRLFIVIDDRTSHGGVVFEASQLSLTHNKPITRVWGLSGYQLENFKRTGSSSESP